VDNRDNNFDYTQYVQTDSEEVGEEFPAPVRKSPVRAILILLACIGIIILLVLGLVPRWDSGPGFSATEIEGYYEVNYEWMYKGSKWYYNATIPKQTYQYFESQKRTGDYREYVMNDRDDELMSSLADFLSKEAEKKGWGEADTVSLVLSFVQSMSYTDDEVTTGYDEYPRYPVETMKDGGGDCEDTAILFTSIVREMGYGVALLELKEDKHMAAGVLISQEAVDNWNRDYPLTYYPTENGEEMYAYCETTSEGWKLGQKPEDLESTTARIIDVY
jgi:hypothetical protein